MPSPTVRCFTANDRNIAQAAIGALDGGQPLSIAHLQLGFRALAQIPELCDSKTLVVFHTSPRSQPDWARLILDRHDKIIIALPLEDKDNQLPPATTFTADREIQLIVLHKSLDVRNYIVEMDHMGANNIDTPEYRDLHDADLRVTISHLDGTPPTTDWAYQHRLVFRDFLNAFASPASGSPAVWHGIAGKRLPTPVWRRDTMGWHSDADRGPWTGTTALTTAAILAAPGTPMIHHLWNAEDWDAPFQPVEEIDYETMLFGENSIFGNNPLEAEDGEEDREEGGEDDGEDGGEEGGEEDEGEEEDEGYDDSDESIALSSEQEVEVSKNLLKIVFERVISRVR